MVLWTSTCVVKTFFLSHFNQLDLEASGPTWYHKWKYHHLLLPHQTLAEFPAFLYCPQLQKCTELGRNVYSSQWLSCSTKGLWRHLGSIPKSYVDIENQDEFWLSFMSIKKCWGLKGTASKILLKKEGVVPWLIGTACLPDFSVVLFPVVMTLATWWSCWQIPGYQKRNMNFSTS